MAVKTTRLIFLDIETTGLDLSKHEILELGAIVTDFELNEKERFVYKIFPEHIETADPKALEISGYTGELWEKEAVPLKRALQRLAKIIPYGERGISVGHNIKKFDLPFINKAYANSDIYNPLSYYAIDTFDLSIAYMIASGNKLENFKLGTLSEHFNLSHNNAHSAMYDIQANLDLFKEIVGYMKIGYLDCINGRLVNH